MKKRLSFFVFIILLVAYFIFSPCILEKELLFIPSWESKTDALSSLPASGNGIPFSFGSVLGYFSPNGQILYSEDIQYAAAVSSDFFVNYSSVSRSLVLQDCRGKIIANLKTESLPFFIGKRFFVVSPDRMVVREYDKEGNELLLISPGSMITSIDAGDSAVVAGTLSGDVYVYKDSSEPVFKYFSTDSRYSVVYSAAVSQDGEHFTIITGLSPQQIISFSYRNDTYVPVFEDSVEPEYRRNTILGYSDDGKYLYAEEPRGLKIYNTENFQSLELSIPGTITKTVFPGENKLSYIVSTVKDDSLLRIYRSDIGKIAEFSFPSDTIYFNQTENCFYIGLNGRIIRYDIIEG